MDLSVKVMLDVSPKLEELVFHVLAGLTAKSEIPAPVQEVKPEPKKAEPKKAKENPAADIPGKEVPKAEAEKLKEVADLKDTAELTEADIVSLRKKVVAFVQQDAEKNKQIFADWLQSHGLTKITDINTKALAAELEGAISA